MASARGKAAVGGLLSGLGRGLQNRAENERDDMLRLREEGIARAREIRQGLQHSSERAEDRSLVVGDRAADRADRSAERSEDRTFNAKERSADRASSEKIASMRGSVSEENRGAMPAGDQRLVNSLKDRYTAKDEFGVEKTDWEAVDRELRKRGRADLASSESEGPAKVKVDSPEYLEAQKQADAWISDQAGTFRSDATDFKDSGGNRAQARQAKVMEIYGQLTGKGGAASPTDAGGSAAPAAPATGAGTRANPLKPTTQEEIDKVPAGTIMEIDGKLYQK